MTAKGLEAMGMFEQMKDLRGLIQDAPDRVVSAREMAKNAQAVSAASPAATAVSSDFEPVNGVSLEVYVLICKGVAAIGNDQSQAPLLAAAQGISPSDWEIATATWNARITANRAVSQQFSALYQTT